MCEEPFVQVEVVGHDLFTGTNKLLFFGLLSVLIPLLIKFFLVALRWYLQSVIFALRSCSNLWISFTNGTADLL